jgi:xanthine dehydrogenase accessory factor
MKGANASWKQFDEYVLDFALDRLRLGERIAIVTLVHIEGSSPRPLGAQIAVSETGEWIGYLSGGCIERAVVAEAVAAIRSGKNRRVRYGRGSKYLDIQLPCGSAIELVFDVAVTRLELETIDARLNRRVPAAMRIPMNAMTERETFTRIYAPRTRLVIAGIGPSAVQLCRLGLLSGFEVVLYSPDRHTREEALRTTGVEVVAITSPASMPDIHADRYTAVVVMFHDHEWEAKLLPLILETEAFYIGALGSRKTHAQRIERLIRSGIEREQIERIHGPAGLFEGGKSAPAIAVSILGEIMQASMATGFDAVLLPEIAVRLAVPALGFARQPDLLPVAQP